MNQEDFKELVIYGLAPIWSMLVFIVSLYSLLALQSINYPTLSTIWFSILVAAIIASIFAIGFAVKFRQRITSNNQTVEGKQK